MKNPIESIRSRLAAQGEFGQKLMKAGVGSMGIKLAYTAIAFLNSMLLAKILGAEGFGIYAYVFALMQFLSIPTQMGIPALVIRELAIANAHQRWALMRGLITRAHQAVGLFALVMVTLVLVVLFSLRDSIEPVKMQTLLVGLFLVVIVPLSLLRAAMLSGLRHVVLAQLVDELVRPGIFLLMLLFIYIMQTPGVSAVTVMVQQLVAYLLAFMAGLYLFFRKQPKVIWHVQAGYDSARWLKSSIPIGLAGALNYINGQSDILVLGMFREDAEVGVYRVAMQMSIFVTFGLLVMNNVQAPHIAHLYSSNDRQRLQRMVTQSSRATLAFTLPVVLTLVIFGREFIRLAFGEEFSAAYWPMVILCAGQAFNAAMGPVVWLLNMTGHERDTTRGIAMAAMINVVLNFTLVPMWGMLGAATSTSVTVMTLTLMLRRRVYQRTGIRASAITMGRR